MDQFSVAANNLPGLLWSGPHCCEFHPSGLNFCLREVFGAVL